MQHFRPFLNFDKCRPEVVSDVISYAAVDYVSMDVLATFSESRLNSGRIFRFFGQQNPFYPLLCTI